MILQSLVAYYETLARQGAIAKPGWGDYKISYAVNLNQQGEVIGILSLEKEVMRGKKTVSVPTVHMLPEGVKKSSGIRPQFLWPMPLIAWGCLKTLRQRIWQKMRQPNGKKRKNGV